MSRWLIDSDHSVATFAVRHMMVADVHGQFNRITGELMFSGEAPGRTELSVMAEAEGVYTGIAKRDAHLRSPDFFDVARFPHIAFLSTGAEVKGGRLALVRGELTLHGVTRSLELGAESFGPATAQDGDVCMGLRLSAAIDREEFGMAWNVPIVGGLMVSREVRLTLDIEADLAET